VADCWADTLKVELSQGDLLTTTLVGTSVAPQTPLSRGPTKGKGIQSWNETTWRADSNGIGHYLARGRHTHVIVLSEDCEIDKDGGKAPLLVAPVLPTSLLQTAEAMEAVKSRRRYPFLPLPELAGQIPESYLDLRCITYVQRPLVTEEHRTASMTKGGVAELVKQIIAFLTHVPVEKIVVPK
jgi:hypothetical protein